MKAHSFAAAVAAAFTFVLGVTSFPLENVQHVNESCGPTLACAPGLICNQDAKCAVLEELGEEVRETLRLRKRQQNSTPVTGAVTGRAPVNRLPIQYLQAQRPDIFNMFVSALYSMQRVSESNSRSYYQIAGIHGRPFIPWEEASSSSQDTSTGYCTHDSALFGTWHRPYLALFEQRIVAHALAEANRFSGSARSRWVTAARNVRLPYWDWAAGDLQSSIPSVVRQQSITITRATSSGSSQQVQVANPLYSYRFTNSGFQNQYFDNPYSGDDTTLRYPSGSRSSSNNAQADSVMRAGYSSRRQNTYNLFSIPSFREFSNTAFSAGGQPNGWTSVESIHNDVHVNVGGTNGWMTAVDYSSFDPIFWLHHAQVDRLVAIYQAIYPGRNVTPQPASGTFAHPITSSNQQDTIDTTLNPFKKTNGAYYTSRDVSSAGSIFTFNYAYLEVPYNLRGDQAGMRSFATGRVNALYGPNGGSNKVKRQVVSPPNDTGLGSDHREWIVHMVFAPSDLDASAECLVFLGEVSSDPIARKTQDSFVGGGASFVKARPNMESTRKITATVPITDALKQNGINPDDVKTTVEYLKSNLHWVMQKGGSVKVDLSTVPSLIVGCSAAVVTQGGADQLPIWGEFETFYEVTEQKRQGLTLADKNIVASKDVTNVLSSSSSSSSSTQTSSSSASQSSSSEFSARQSSSSTETSVTQEDTPSDPLPSQPVPSAGT